jgi:hypothetical protein
LPTPLPQQRLSVRCADLRCVVPTRMQLCPWTQAFEQEVLHFLTAWRSDHQPEVLRCRPERPDGRREDPEPQLSPIQFSVVNGSAAPPAVTGCNRMRLRHDRQVARCAGATETPKSRFRHRSDVKSQVRLELIGLTRDVFVTKEPSESLDRSLGKLAGTKGLGAVHGVQDAYSRNVPRSRGLLTGFRQPWAAASDP